MPLPQIHTLRGWKPYAQGLPLRRLLIAQAALAIEIGSSVLLGGRQGNVVACRFSLGTLAARGGSLPVPVSDPLIGLESYTMNHLENRKTFSEVTNLPAWLGPSS